MLARRSLVVVAVLLAIVVGVLWFSRRSSEADEKIDAGASASALVVDESRAASSTPIEVVAGPESARVASEIAASAPAVVAPSTKFTLHGTVTVVDPDATLASPLDGTLNLGIWKTDTGTSVDAAVRAGEWSLEIDDLDGVTHFTIWEVRIGGSRLVVDSPKENVPLPPDGRLDIVARVPLPTTLRVLDARDRHDLPGIVIVSSAEFPDEDLDHPGLEFAQRILRSKVTSPIRLTSIDDWLGQRNVSVGSEGYAWKHTLIDTAIGGEQIVELQLGGDLEIHVRGLDQRARVVMRLRRENKSPPCASVELETDGAFSLRGLQPGKLLVKAEIGDWFRQPIVLAEKTVDVLEGRSTSVELELEPAPVARLATARGRVLVPKAWAVERALVTLELLDASVDGADTNHSTEGSRTAAAPEGFDVFEWRIGPVQAGRYELGLFEPCFSIGVELPPGDTTGIELRVPPPVDLLVRVVHASTGEPIPDLRVHWYSAWPEGVTGGSVESAKFDEAAQVYEIRAPDAALELQINDERFAQYRERWDPSRDGRERVIRLERACGFDLALQDGDTRVPVPEDWWGEAQAAEGTVGQPSSMWNDAGAFHVMVSAPGTYTIQPPTIDGYEPVPLQRIDVRAGEFTQHVVRLERKKL
jgi:hypothetical protein